MYTSHGHHISGTALYSGTRLYVARCGGPGLCIVCSREAALIHSIKEPQVIEPVIQKYKRSVEVEAIQLTEENIKKVAEWANGTVLPIHNSTPTLRLLSREGNVSAVVGDYVIKGGEDDFYPCKPDIFMATYEIV